MRPYSVPRYAQSSIMSFHVIDIQEQLLRIHQETNLKGCPIQGNTGNDRTSNRQGFQIDGETYNFE